MKYKPGSLKKSGKIKTKKKSPEALEEKKKESEKIWVFYEDMWNQLPHICASCNKPIYGEMKSTYIEHVLEKSVHEHLKFDKRNIQIICEPCHSLKSAGFPTEQYRKIIEEKRKELL